MENESFCDLVEDYLDLDIMKEKCDNDISIIMKSKHSKSPFSINNTITMNNFVNNFLNIKVDASNLYHCGLKQLKCPYVIGISNEFANKNPEYVKFGILLLVIDANNNRGTYINPIYLKTLGCEKAETLKIDKKIESMLKIKEMIINILKIENKVKKLSLIKKYEEIG